MASESEDRPAECREQNGLGEESSAEKRTLGGKGEEEVEKEEEHQDTADEMGEKKTADGDAAKRRSILEACKWKNLDELRAWADSPGGFLTDDIRQQAWPILLGVSLDESRESDASGGYDDGWKELPRHRDEDQIQLDVNRAFVYYPHHKSESDLARQKDELSALIVSVLRRHSYLCYFQGYHDICQVLLLVLPHEARACGLARLSALRIRDFMLPSMGPVIAQLQLIPDILHRADPALAAHLAAVEPFFALSGTLTMYAHDVPTLAAIARLFDSLLAHEPAFALYLFGALVIARRDMLLAVPHDEPEMLHSVLTKLLLLPAPETTGPDAATAGDTPSGYVAFIESLLISARLLLAEHPPDALPTWRRRLPGWAWLRGAAVISPASALRTARRQGACAAQPLAAGSAFFDRQVRELRWAERRDAAARALHYALGLGARSAHGRRYGQGRRRLRRPSLAGALLLAVLVGAAAVWLRRAQSSESAGSEGGLPVQLVRAVVERVWEVVSLKEKRVAK